MDKLNEKIVFLEISEAAVPTCSVEGNIMPDKGEQEEGRRSLGNVKEKKNVSFKNMVVNITFNEDWEMQTSQSILRNEDHQHKAYFRNF